MARVRANLNSFSTGFVSKKVRGNVDFEGYNNGLSECTNFLVQHTGGVFKRGGTEFIAYTKDFEPAELIPFYLSVDQAYMLEFGDLANPTQAGSSYIRFHTKSGVVENMEILHSFFNLGDLRTGTSYQRGETLTIITLIGVFVLEAKKDPEGTFTLDKFDFTYPPLGAANCSKKKAINITKSDGIYTITAKETQNPPVLFYKSDEKEVIAITGQFGEQEQTIYLSITVFVSKTKIQAVWKDSLNTIKEPDIASNTEFIVWRISQFTPDRVAAANIDYLGGAMYEGRLFLAAGNMIWGSSLARGDLLDFMPGTNDDSGLMFSISEMKSDEVLWIVGQSKLFLGTAGGLFMSGAATLNDSAVTPYNFRVRLFEKLGAHPLIPISANNAIFFIDTLGRNVHEIVLSAETGGYQANDLSLIGEDLTHSGIVSHTWQQTPIKTYWCAVNDGYLCSLTYLKNNGIMAWAKHEIAGKNAKVENISALTARNSDNIWMIVKRQITGSDGLQKIVRSIEYMHPIYDPLAQEEFKQFFVDSGKIKELKHTIKAITTGYNYTVTLDTDIRPNADAQELKVLFAAMDLRVEYGGNVSPNPFLAFQPFPDEVPAHWTYRRDAYALVAKNFHRNANGKYVFDVFDAFDRIKKDNIMHNLVRYTYEPYRNQSITHGKIDSSKYVNTWEYSSNPPDSVGIFIKAADIRRVDLGQQTRIYCDTANLSNNDVILLRQTNLYGSDGRQIGFLDYCYTLQRKFKVLEKREDSFVLSPLQGINVNTTASPQHSGVGEIYKQVATIDTSTDPFETGIFKAGSDTGFVVTGNVPNTGGDVYINKVSGMIEINNTKYKIKSSIYDGEAKESAVTLYDYTKSPDEQNVFVPLDAYGFGVYDIDQENNGNMYEYFTRMSGLDHLDGQEVSVCSNGNSLTNRVVEKHADEADVWYGFELDHPSMYCVAGLPVTAKLKTVPFSGGNVLGSSVGVVGQQVHAVFSLYHSLGGKYGTEEDRTYPFPYPKPDIKPFNMSKSLFTGISKLPLINSKNIYERCIYIEHSEPLSFNLLAVTEEISVTDA